MPKDEGFDDGRWNVVTLGFFVRLLIDVGPDPVIKFRVLEDGPVDDNGKFTRRIELIQLPDGYVKSALDNDKDCRIDKTLVQLIKAGIVK